MKGILIFDHLNDVLFKKCDKNFADYVQKLAKDQQLISENKDEDEDETQLNLNILMQLFSPIVTSQQIMTSQFGNAYTSIKCENGQNMVFDEFMGNTFMYISTEDVELMKRILGVCVSIVRLVCGPDVASLKKSKPETSLVSSLLDAWMTLRESEQSFLIEAVDQLSVNPDLASAILKVLTSAANKLKAQSEFSNFHLLVLVEQKFLSLFSSKNAQDLNASDILMMTLMCYVANNKDGKEKRNVSLCENSFERQNDEAKCSSFKLGHSTLKDIWELFENSRYSPVSENVYTFTEEGSCGQLVLLGSDENFISDAVYISKIGEGINLVIIVETTNSSISSGLYDTFNYLNIIYKIQLQRDLDELKPAFESLEAAVKKTVDGIKKHRAHVGNDVDMCQRRLQMKWEFIRKKYLEIFKTRDLEMIVQIESNISGFIDTVRELFRLTCFEKEFLRRGMDIMGKISCFINQKMNDFSDFLKAKALKSFSAGSYLEEFPGLVHFIYIDRSTHRLTTPTIDFTNSEALQLTTKKIWSMVEDSRIHLQEGHTSVIWKDTTFSYAYFLWFEDSSSTPLKCKTYINHTTNNFGIPGILCGDFYRKFANAHFPKIPLDKLRIYELYCVHLGLVTPSCVLEHSRRIAATIWEVTGLPNNPADIL